MGEAQKRHFCYTIVLLKNWLLFTVPLPPFKKMFHFSQKKQKNSFRFFLFFEELWKILFQLSFGSITGARTFEILQFKIFYKKRFEIKILNNMDGPRDSIS